VKLGSVIHVLPTPWFGEETLQHRGINFVALDFGRREKIRPVFNHVFPGISGLVFVIDCGDKAR